MSARTRLSIAIAGGFVFGAVDQYLGTTWVMTHAGPWSVGVSGLSAPWLALPFLAGCREEQPSSALRAGLTVTLSALLGYIVMINSPIEGVSPSHVDVVTAMSSQAHVILPGLVTGPMFGWLGHRWRVARAWSSALLVAGAFCLEPAATHLVQMLPITAPAPAAVGVSLAEVAVGCAAAGYFVASRRRPTRGEQR